MKGEGVIVPKWVLVLAPIVGMIVTASVSYGTVEAKLASQGSQIERLHLDRTEELKRLRNIERSLAVLCDRLGVDCGEN